MNHSHHCLLLEEIMLIEKDDIITVAISNNYCLLYQSQFKKDIRLTLDEFPSRLLILDYKVYFIFRVRVELNTSYEAFNEGHSLSRDEVIYKCKRKVGDSINTVLPTRKCFLIKFHHLFDHPKSIIFWSQTNTFIRNKILKIYIQQ